jgi:hypothetical protein
MNSYFLRFPRRQRYNKVFTLAICKRAAIHDTVTNVSFLNRRHAPANHSGHRLHPRSHKSVPVAIIPEDDFTTISPVHHMIDRPGIFHSQFPRHHQCVGHSPILVTHKNRTCCPKLKSISFIRHSPWPTNLRYSSSVIWNFGGIGFDGYNSPLPLRFGVWRTVTARLVCWAWTPATDCKTAKARPRNVEQQNPRR